MQRVSEMIATLQRSCRRPAAHERRLTQAAHAAARWVPRSRRRAFTSGSGRRAAAASRWSSPTASKTFCRSLSMPRTTATSPADRGGASGHALLVPARWRNPAATRSGVALSARRAARGRPRSSIPPRFAWTDGDWRGVERTGQVIYEMHVGTFTPGRHLASGRRANCRSWPNSGITLLEVMPVADFPGRVRLGLRRRQPVRADPALRGAGRLPQLRRRGPSAAAWASSSTSSTTTSVPIGNYLPEFSEPYFTDNAQDRLGRGDQLRRPGLRPGPRVLHRQRRATGSRSSTSTGCGSTRRRTSTTSTPRTSTSWRRSPAPSASAAGGRETFVVAENEPQDVEPDPAGRARRLRHGRDVERRPAPLPRWWR